MIDIPKNFHETLGMSPVYVFEITVLPYLNEPHVFINVQDDSAEITINSGASTAELKYLSLIHI